MIRLSPTNLDRWFSLGCPAAWWYSYQYSTVEPNPYMEFGNKVHAVLEGSDEGLLIDDKNAIKTAEKIQQMANLLGLQDLEKPIIEMKQEWKIAPGITFVRKVDRIMLEPNGTPVIVDWKTHAGYGWKSLTGDDGEQITPQTLGTQTNGYFLDPPKAMLKELGLRSWPKAMYYLVGPARGQAQFFRQERTPDADENFQALLALAISAIKGKEFPKNYGKICHDCDFKDLCFELPGHTDKYTRYR